MKCVPPKPSHDLQEPNADFNQLCDAANRSLAASVPAFMEDLRYLPNPQSRRPSMKDFASGSTWPLFQVFTEGPNGNS